MRKAARSAEMTDHAVVFNGRWARMAIVFDAGAAERAAELELRIVDAQLRALKLQLHPHFLFNILNTIAMNIRNGDSANALRMTTVLGEVFRHLVESGVSNVLEILCQATMRKIKVTHRLIGELCPDTQFFRIRIESFLHIAELALGPLGVLNVVN
jgi:hypothetical protein